MAQETILQRGLPPEMAGASGLPGIAPCGASDWIRVDDAYGAQMALRRRLIAERPEAVLWCPASALPLANALLDEVLTLLPALGFDVAQAHVTCPDGQRVALDRGAALHTLAQLVQEDFCILDKRGDEHVLAAAVLCFPASWTLAEKVGRPLSGIHAPVAEYDGQIARRVQRLFDGVQPGRPLWRFNKLHYADASLFQPRSEADVRPPEPPVEAAFIRSERQCILRLPQSGAAVFSIHTYVVRA